MKNNSATTIDRRPWPFPRAIWGIVLLGIVLAWFGIKGRRPPKPEPNTSGANGPATPAPQPTVTASPLHTVQRARTSPLSPTVLPLSQSEPAASATTQPKAAGSTVYARDLLTALAQFNPTGGVSPQKSEELKASFKQLAAQGAAAVPAIREYLGRFQDIDFDSAGTGKLTGYSSLRIGLLDVLGQIGGPEAVGLSLQTLQQTGDFQEIAFLSKILEKQLPPEQFRPAALAAATEGLNQAASGELAGRNVAPLFEVLQRFGDENIASLLEQVAGRWNYYATLSLAGLPDGAGIPALIRLANDPAIKGNGIGDFALRPLAQAAMQYPQARAALVDQARANGIPDTAWPTVSASLTGNYMQYGNQVFGSTAPTVTWSNEQIGSRIALVDQLLAATSSPAAQQPLQSARALLLTRLAQLNKR